MSEHFTDDDLRAMADEEEVRVETRTRDGRVRRTIIWIVVADEVPYVRSVRGSRGRWYQRLVHDPEGSILTARRSIPFRAVPANDPASIEACSGALTAKYAADPSLASMLHPDTLGTTLRLEPA
jgi:hypothetical protein